ncbi:MULTISPECIES: L-dopachrome tautomerase-related protein [Microcoleaceae]|uniref:L-dopachrome tautomerase-related protein n=2 Tax=Bacteria TaxID=2 RepID=UPI001D15624F|nr:L-dopachrome tautomerase-related protein [Tychonema sp. LEGE 06208]
MANLAATKSMAAVPSLPADKSAGNLELITLFEDAMPIGVAVSKQGRIFISYPRLVDDVEFTVAELKQPLEKNGNPVPYPNAEIHKLDLASPSEKLLCVQGMTIDARDRLWLLDHAKIKQNLVPSGGPKLVGIDLNGDRIVKKILFPESVASANSTLNDVRVDLRWGEDGIAFITDSSEEGPNGIVVVDLATGNSWRKLNDHPSTKPIPGFLPIVEGQPMMVRHPNKPAKHIHTGSDGIALSGDGQRLFYCPLASRHLYSVSIEALVNQNLPDENVAATVIDHGEKGASGGMVSDDKNHLYVTNYENNSILRHLPDGTWETLAHDARMLWPNCLFVAQDGYLYFTVDQWNRNPSYHNGQDLREKPYSLFRIQINAGQVLLDRS